MSFLTGYRRVRACSRMTPNSHHLLWTAHAWVCRKAALGPLHRVRSTRNACERQPELARAAPALIQLCFVRVSNTNPSFAGQRDGWHDISIAWYAMRHRLCWLVTALTASEQRVRFAWCRFPDLDINVAFRTPQKPKILCEFNGWPHKLSERSPGFKEFSRSAMRAAELYRLHF